VATAAALVDEGASARVSMLGTSASPAHSVDGGGRIAVLMAGGAAIGGRNMTCPIVTITPYTTSAAGKYSATPCIVDRARTTAPPLSENAIGILIAMFATMMNADPSARCATTDPMSTRFPVSTTGNRRADRRMNGVAIAQSGMIDSRPSSALIMSARPSRRTRATACSAAVMATTVQTPTIAVGASGRRSAERIPNLSRLSITLQAKPSIERSRRNWDTPHRRGTNRKPCSFGATPL